MTVAEEMNFQRAAQRLYISQQALSTHIQKLEEMYGVELFVRRPRLRLTLAGERMLAHARRIVEAGDEMDRDLSGVVSRRANMLIIGASQLRSTVFITKIWERSHAMEPNIDFTIRQITNAQMEVSLLNGAIDIYIGMNRSASSALEICRLVSEPLCCAFRLSTLAACGVNDPKALIDSFSRRFDLRTFLKAADHSYVLPSHVNLIRTIIDRYLYTNRIMPHIALECEHQSTVWEFCKIGCGIALLSPAVIYGADPTTIPDDMCAFIVDERSMSTDISTAYMRSGTPLPYIDSFLAITNEIFDDYGSFISVKDGRLL